MANIEELQRALRQGSDAKARLSGLDEQYQQAQDRGVATTKKDKWGQVSPLSVLADVVGQSRSRRDMRELAPQREAARSTIAQNEHAGALYNAVRQQKRDDVSDKQFGIKRDDTKQAALTKAKAELATRSITDRINPHSGEVERLETGPNGQLFRDGVKIPDAHLYALAPEKSETVDSSGYSHTPDRKDFTKALNTGTEIAHIQGKAANLPQSDLDLMNANGTIFKNLIVGAVTPNMFEQFRKQNFTGLSDSAQDFLMQINMMDGERRHALFGAALTGKEDAKFEDIALAAKGLSIEQMLRRLDIVAKSNRDNVEAMDVSSTHFKGLGAFDSHVAATADTYLKQPQVIGTTGANQAEDGTPTITPRNAANAPDINAINAIKDDAEFMRAYEASSKGL